jgi:hypothetical protein
MNVRFCWHCGRKLWGNHHALAVIDGHERTLHKGCVDKARADVANGWASTISVPVTYNNKPIKGVTT